LGQEVTGKGHGRKAFKYVVRGMDQEIEASFDGEAKLSFREEDFCKSVGIGADGQDGACKQATPGGTNADGAEFVKVGLIFEGRARTKWQKVTGSEMPGRMMLFRMRLRGCPIEK
jgi:hypothetical protein